MVVDCLFRINIRHDFLESTIIHFHHFSYHCETRGRHLPIMPPPPFTPAQAPSMGILMKSLQPLTNYTNIARAYCIYYLTPCLPLLRLAIYSLAFILCYLLRRTLPHSLHPPTKSSHGQSNKPTIWLPHKRYNPTVHILVLSTDRDNRRKVKKGLKTALS